jgi:outer membrane immunogenic protein
MRPALLAAAVVAAFSAPAAAADLQVRKAQPAPAFVSMHDWSGFYAGAQVGYGRSAFDWSAIGYADSQGDEYFGKSHKGNFFGGVHAGYNLQAGSLVYGIEGDIEYAGAKHQYLHAPDLNWGYDQKIGWQGSLRARLGYAHGNALLYATGGLAVAETKFNAVCYWCEVSNASDTSKKTRVGWTIGGGVQYAIDRSWSVRAEYRYTDLGKQNVDTSAFWTLNDDTENFYADSVRLTSHAVRLGISYAFDRPVVAKY